MGITKRLLLSLLVFIPIIVNGQDIIIKSNGDSLKCKITSQDAEKIYVEVLFKGKKIPSFINRADTKEVIVGHSLQKQMNTSSNSQTNGQQQQLNSNRQIASSKQDGVILSVESELLYLDLKFGQVVVGDKYKVTKAGGFFTHPVTGEKIKKEDEIIAVIEITDVKDNYSVAKAYPAEDILKLSKGMNVVPLSSTDKTTKRKVIVLPFSVVGDGGQLGLYMSEALSREIVGSNNFKVIDLQGIDPNDKDRLNEFIQNNSIDFIISGTSMQPEVTQTETGVPVKGILAAGELVTGKNLGSAYVSDVRSVTMKALVNITLKLLDAKSGEILFNATEMDMQSGLSSLDFEQGVLGGSRIQGGVAGFYQSIAGQATLNAVRALAVYFDDFMVGTIKEKNFQGHIITVGTKNSKKGNKDDFRITKISNSDNGMLLTLNRHAKVGKNFFVSGHIAEKSSVTGKEILSKRKKIGILEITSTDKDGSFASINLDKDILASDIEKNYSNFSMNRHKDFILSLGYKIALEEPYRFFKGPYIGFDYYPDIFNGIYNRLYFGADISSLLSGDGENAIFDPSLKIGYTPFYGKQRMLLAGLVYYPLKHAFIEENYSYDSYLGDYVSSIEKTNVSSGFGPFIGLHLWKITFGIEGIFCKYNAAYATYLGQNQDFLKNLSRLEKTTLCPKFNFALIF
jgi:hypothetical protein